MKQDSKNYKVRCVGYNREEHHFTIGKVYDVVDGKITNDNGFTYCSYDDVIRFLSVWYKFEKVTDDSIISRVIFNDPATIILWSDGTKTIAKTHGDDAFDPEKGFAVACAKKLLGNGDSFRMEFAKWAPVDEEPNIDGFKVGDRVTLALSSHWLRKAVLVWSSINRALAFMTVVAFRLRQGIWEPRERANGYCRQPFVISETAD